MAPPSGRPACMTIRRTANARPRHSGASFAILKVCAQTVSGPEHKPKRAAATIASPSEPMEEIAERHAPESAWTVTTASGRRLPIAMFLAATAPTAEPMPARDSKSPVRGRPAGQARLDRDRQAHGEEAVAHVVGKEHQGDRDDRRVEHPARAHAPGLPFRPGGRSASAQAHARHGRAEQGVEGRRAHQQDKCRERAESPARDRRPDGCRSGEGQHLHGVRRRPVRGGDQFGYSGGHPGKDDHHEGSLDGSYEVCRRKAWPAAAERGRPGRERRDP